MKTIPEALIDLDALAARWGLSFEATKRTVKLRKVPHLDLGAGMRVVWSQVRFRPADIERWEAENLKEFGGDQPEPEPTRATARGGKGFWD